MFKQIGDPVLRKKAVEIPVSEISSKKVQSLIKKMKESLRKSPTGVGLAAPQIGVSEAVFIVSKYVLDGEGLRYESKEDAAKKKESEDYFVFINPGLSKMSRKKQEKPEGCLSVEGKFGEVERSEKVFVEAYDEAGKKFKRGASGFFAQVLQHEYDHLQGVLFVDKVKSVTSNTSEF